MSVTAHYMPPSTRKQQVHPPLFDQFLYRALHKVARGEIGTTSETGALRHRTEDLSALLVSSLFVLYRDGFVALRSTADRRDGWITAELTLAGNHLLSAWVRQLSASREP
jgi:hypothetical protein